MKESDIISKVSKSCLLNAEMTKAVIDAYKNEIASQLVAGSPVRLTGVGTLTPIESKQRNGRNLRTGELIIIPAKKSVKFKGAIELKRRLNK